MIYKNVKCNSNLGYTDGMTVTMELKYLSKEDGAKLKFSTGFETECRYEGNKRDHTNSQILTYSYDGYNSETHYLHVRVTDDVMYCQTVQTGISAGGSTWQIRK